jgi:Tfp pilus assembly protein PilE/TM2 domain-containing membrane protein YozV
MSQAANPYATPAANLAPGHKQCDSCGADILIKAEICPKCGVRQRKPVSKEALLVLTFLLGGLGAHKFYLGKNWQGALYVLLFFIFFPLAIVIALIEFIVYAFTSSESLNEKYTAAGSAGAIVIITIVGGFILVALIGILAAIAIPAYQDYTVRARVASAINATADWRTMVEVYYLENHKFPNSPTEIGGGVPPAESPGTYAHVGLGENGALTVTMLALPGVARRLEGATIVFQPRVEQDTVRWDCTGGTLEPRYRPSLCRSPR